MVAAPPPLAPVQTGLTEAEIQLLKSTTRQIGEHFSEVSELLEQMSQRSGHLLHASERLLALASGQSDGESTLTSSAAALQPALDHFHDCEDRMTQVASRLESCDGKILEILRVRHEWQATIAPLKHIHSLFSIEAAKLPVDLQQMYASMTREIQRVEAELMTMFAEKFALLESIHATARGIVEHLRNTIAEQHRRTESKRNQLEQTFVALQADLDAISRQDLGVLVASRSIASDVERIVVGLQFHDIIEQKVQHLLKGACPVDSPSAKDSAVAVEQKTSTRRSSSRLQLAQLGAIEQDLMDAGTQINNGLRQIVTKTKELDECCLALKELNRLTVSADGLVQALLDAFEECRTLVATTITDADLSFAQLSPLRNTALNMTGTLKELAMSMHFIALNVQIQAVQHGAGTGLETLASRTAEISVYTNNVSERALVDLEGLALAIREAVRDFDAVRDNAAANQQQLTQEGAQCEVELHALRDRCLEGFYSVTAHVEEMENMALSAQAAVSGLEPVRERLFGMRTALSARAALEPEPAAETKAEADGKPAENDWKEQYTMACEREVHAAVLDERDPVRIASMTAHAFEHTELFEPDSSSVATATLVAPDANPSPGDKPAEEGIELF